MEKEVQQNLSFFYVFKVEHVRSRSLEAVDWAKKSLPHAEQMFTTGASQSRCAENVARLRLRRGIPGIRSHLKGGGSFNHDWGVR